jgi:polyisoprenoid-binding protein YceI
MTLFLSLLLTLGLVVSPATADPVSPSADSATYQFQNAESTMTVFGSSNVRDWTMDVTQINGSVALGETSGAVPAIQSIQVEIPVQQMVSDKDRLQRHAHEALHKEDYPTISFAASDIEVTPAEADSFSVVASGKMTIKGNTHAVELTAKGAQQSDGTLNVVGEHELKLSTFDVERPSLMFGAIKVDDPIRIGFDVVLAPQSGAASTE